MLELKHIVKKYDDNVILDDISLSVEDGEIISILGPSGGGKTTLLNVILGITPISSGQIVYDGTDLSGVSMQKRGFNIVFQDLCPISQSDGLSKYCVRSSQYAWYFHQGGGFRADLPAGSAGTCKQADQPAFRRSEAAGGIGADTGHETENTASRRTAERS